MSNIIISAVVGAVVAFATSWWLISVKPQCPLYTKPVINFAGWYCEVLPLDQR